jgi:hypothetical protein
MRKGKKYSRREFINQTTLGTMGLFGYSLLNKTSAQDKIKQSGNSRVVVVKDDNALDDSDHFNNDVIINMIDTGICSLTGIENISDAWKCLFPGISLSTIICIKINCLFTVCTHRPVTESVVNSLTKMKIGEDSFPAANIIVWDRSDGDLTGKGYDIVTGDSGYRCYGTSHSGVGYNSTEYDVGGNTQRLSRILTDISDYMINLNVMKNHGSSGVTLSLKNHYGTCNNMGGSMHDGYCNPYIPALNALEPIRTKQVVCICDAIFALVSGGPSFYPPQAKPKSLIFSKDPVAHDYVGTQILLANGMGVGSANTAYHIATAASAPYNLGTNDPEKIERIDINNPSSTGTLSERKEAKLPGDFCIFQNYPNPFNATTLLSYQLHKPAKVKVAIYDVKGSIVRRLINKQQGVGEYRISWDGTLASRKVAPSGLYFARFQINNLVKTIRMQLIK